MNRKSLAYTLASVVALACATFVYSAAPGGGAAPGAAAGGAAAPGGGPGAGGARGGAGALGGGRGAGRGAPTPPGPAAPVPPEVAQPNADQVKTINDEIQKLIASDNSPTKPLMEKYQSMLMLPPPRLNVAATYTQTGQRQGARHEGFVTQAKAGNIDLVLDGDSITDLWLSGAANKPVYDKYFGQYKTANFAISGDTTQGVLWGLHNGEAQGIQPKAAMLMIGTNNTGGNTAAEIAEGVGAVVLEMRQNWPNAKILLLAIFPRNASATDATRLKIGEINKIIKKLDDGKHVFYMDIGAKFLTPDGTLTNDIMGDLLHPTAKGYEIWGDAVKDKLAELMK